MGGVVTGADLADALRHAASQRKMPIMRFLRPLSTDPMKWLQGLEKATSPKPWTVARVRALLEDRPIPALPAHKTRSPTSPAAIVHCHREPDPVPPCPPVDRGPCWYCGTRRDIGCSHLHYRRLDAAA